MNVENFPLFYIAVFLFLGALATGIGALEHRVVSEGTVERLPREAGSPIQYGNLSELDRRKVDRAIAGERVVVRAPGELPDRYKKRGEFGVERDGDVFLLDRRLFFNPRTKFARASGGLLLGGLLATAWAFRREHGS